MTDNINLSLGSGGDTLAADEIASVKYQRVKVAQGIDGVAVDVSSVAPLEVTMANAALTAAVHAITASINSSSLMDGLTAMTPRFVAINATPGENNTVVAVVSGKKIRVLSFVLVGETANSGTVRFEDGAGGPALTGVMPLGDNSDPNNTSNGIMVCPFSPVGWFETSVATLLNLESLTVAAKGCLVYVEV